MVLFFCGKLTAQQIQSLLKTYIHIIPFLYTINCLLFCMILALPLTLLCIGISCSLFAKKNQKGKNDTNERNCQFTAVLALT